MLMGIEEENVLVSNDVFDFDNILQICDIQRVRHF